jgi:hypothetical protein
MGFKTVQKKPPDKTDIVYKKISTKNDDHIPINKYVKSKVQYKPKIIVSKIDNSVKNKKDRSKIDAINNKYEGQLNTYMTVKTSLKSITTSDSVINKIFNALVRMNKIVIHTYQFFKLYILYHHHKLTAFPIIDKQLIVLIMKTLCREKIDNRGRQFSKKVQILRDDLHDFYNQHYKHLLNDIDQLSYKGLTQMIEYEATTVLTCISNHLQEHFEDSIEKLIAINFDKRQFCYDFKDDKIKLRDFKIKLSQFKDDIMTGSNKVTDVKYVEFKNKIQKEIFNKVILIRNLNIAFPVKNEDNVDNVNKKKKSKTTIKSTLQEIASNNPLELLDMMIEISRYCEKLDLKKRSNLLLKENFNTKYSAPSINCFPLRTSIIPKYVDIDTTLILSLLNDTDKTGTDMLSRWKEIWETHFKIDSKVFRQKGYKFARQISTDGFGCSILFIQEKLYKENKAMRQKLMKKPSCYSEDKYVDNLNAKEKEEVLKLKLIGGDVGLIELGSFTDGETKIRQKDNGKIFRNTNYCKITSAERRHETKSDVYGEKLLNDKKNTIILIDNKEKSVEEIESELSLYNSNSCSLQICKNFIQTKNRINMILMKYYEKEMYRKYKWYSYINQQKFEKKMIKKISDKMGPPKKVAILLGDFDQNGNYMKGLPPAQGVGFRKSLRKGGYKVYLVNEYNTSCKLYKTGESLVGKRLVRLQLSE